MNEVLYLWPVVCAVLGKYRFEKGRICRDLGPLNQIYNTESCCQPQAPAASSTTAVHRVYFPLNVYVTILRQVVIDLIPQKAHLPGTRGFPNRPYPRATAVAVKNKQLNPTLRARAASKRKLPVPTVVSQRLFNATTMPSITPNRDIDSDQRLPTPEVCLPTPHPSIITIYYPLICCRRTLSLSLPPLCSSLFAANRIIPNRLEKQFGTQFYRPLATSPVFRFPLF